MKRLKDLYETYKDKQDCTRTEFVNLYDSMLEDFNKLDLDIRELKVMYNHEYAIVKDWLTSNGSEKEYNKNRIGGFKKMKAALKCALIDLQDLDHKDSEGTTL